MKAIVEALLTKAFDYAGMFPPASLPLNPAVKEYRHLCAHGDYDWLVDRFICNAANLDNLDEALGNEPAPDGALHPTPAASVAPPVNSGEDIEKLAKAVEDTVKARSNLLVDVMEVKFDGELMSLFDQAVPHLAKLEDQEITCLVEVAMTEANLEKLPEILDVKHVDGIKMRMGGVTPAAFPEPEIVAMYLTQIDALDCPFKFTAGLHEPIRYYNNELGAHHHGFLNVLIAMALIRQEDLSISESVEILKTESPTAFEIEEEAIRIQGHTLEMSSASNLWELCAGIGSCSITEPMQGLQRLGVV